MNILLTNDDGIDAVGLSVALAGAKGHDVFIIAPDRQQSATSASLTLRRPISYREANFNGVSGAYSCDGSPVDCAKLGLGKLVPWPPNLLISGCNEGLNVGYDVFYSGTVAAALEGLFVHVPSLAVSLQHPMEKSSRNALKLLPHLIDLAANWSGAGKYLA
ncbi:MAG: 5'/3'-nucleotidase SurE [Planctomycetota bacterium]|nr:5'/3'-nucleotidase SurE [Planctomycetota bacterium]